MHELAAANVILMHATKNVSVLRAAYQAKQRAVCQARLEGRETQQLQEELLELSEQVRVFEDRLSEAEGRVQALYARDLMRQEQEQDQNTDDARSIRESVVSEVRAEGANLALD
jgi:hypothetical protein